MYPVFLNITGRLCVVIGGGSVAERKVKTLLSEGAYVRVVSPNVTKGLAALTTEGKIQWWNKVYSFHDLDKAFLVFAATNIREIQELIYKQAQANKQLVNVVDDPESCSFHVPATLRRGDLSLAVSTGGKSPAVAAFIKRQLEKEFGDEYKILLDIMSLVREKTKTEGQSLSQIERKNVYKKILHDDIVDWIKAGQIDKLRQHLQAVLGMDASDLDINKIC